MPRPSSHTTRLLNGRAKPYWLSSCRTSQLAVLSVALALAMFGARLGPVDGQEKSGSRASGRAMAERARDAWVSRDRIALTLDQPTGITVTGSSVRDVLHKLSGSVHIPVLLDRRIDPDRTVALRAKDQPLREIFTAIGDQVEAQLAQVGPVLYLGPAATAQQIATRAMALDDLAQQLPPAQRRQWLERRPVSWPTLARPREIIQQLLEPLKVDLAHPEQIPHDLWAAQAWPPLTTGEALALVLAGFDLQPQWDDQGRIDLAPADQAVRVKRVYPISPAQLAQVQAIYAQQHGASAIDYQSGRVVVEGNWELHQAIARQLQATAPHDSAGMPRKLRAASGGRNEPRSVYQLRVAQQPIAAVLKYLQEQLDLEISVARELEDQTDRRISFEVHDATLQQLLDKIASASGWAVEVHGKQAHFRPAGSAPRE